MRSEVSTYVLHKWTSDKAVIDTINLSLSSVLELGQLGLLDILTLTDAVDRVNTECSPLL